MKERGIIFSGDNPKLILDGRKTRTRRLMRNQPHRGLFTERQLIARKPPYNEIIASCPYGVAGDRLWVRETWAHERQFDHLPPSQIPQSAHVISRIKYGHEITRGWHKARPSIHMPRWASRITLEITKVRVERLQDISEEDAKAEGMSDAVWSDYDWKNPVFVSKGKGGIPLLSNYASQWDSLHGKGAWDENPWVWVIEFLQSTNAHDEKSNARPN